MMNFLLGMIVPVSISLLLQRFVFNTTEEPEVIYLHTLVSLILSAVVAGVLILAKVIE